MLIEAEGARLLENVIAFPYVRCLFKETDSMSCGSTGLGRPNRRSKRRVIRRLPRTISGKRSTWSGNQQANLTDIQANFFWRIRDEDEKSYSQFFQGSLKNKIILILYFLISTGNNTYVKSIFVYESLTSNLQNLYIGLKLG